MLYWYTYYIYIINVTNTISFYFVLFSRYERTQPQRHLCKTVRKNIITGILEKYNLIEAKVDHGLYRGKKRKKPSSKNQFHEIFLKNKPDLNTALDSTAQF